MATKIKFSFIKIFFRLFSFLADKTNGWNVFVQPKLMLGTALLLSGNIVAQKPVNQNDSIQVNDTIITYRSCYYAGPTQTITADMIEEKNPTEFAKALMGEVGTQPKWKGQPNVKGQSKKRNKKNNGKAKK